VDEETGEQDELILRQQIEFQKQQAASRREERSWFWIERLKQDEFGNEDGSQNCDASESIAY